MRLSAWPAINRYCAASDPHRATPWNSRDDGRVRAGSAARVMRELGWTAVRVRDLLRRGYKDKARGYCRNARC